MLLSTRTGFIDHNVQSELSSSSWSYMQAGRHWRDQMDTRLQKLTDNKGRRHPVSIAAFDWAPDGKSPATSTGPTGLIYQLLVKLLTELLPPDARMDVMDIMFFEAGIFSGDLAPCQRVTADRTSDCCTATDAVPMSVALF